jgi:hypothetical protein
MTIGDRGRRLKFLSVDFVTALSVAECQDYLRRYAETSGQRVHLQEDGSFALRQTVGEDAPVTVALWGTLEAVPRGTWVWGTVIETGARRAGRWVYPLGLLSLGLVVLTLEAALRGAWTLAAVSLLLVIAIGLLAARLWWRRHRYAMQMVNWVYETLYVAPPRE